MIARTGSDGLLGEVLPAGVSWCEALGDLDGVELFPEEEALISRAVEGRRRAFATARHCARKALIELGTGAVPIGRGPRGCPCWPPGVVGSITHCAGYRAAVVARRSTAAAIGIDAEPSDALPDRVLHRIASIAEREHIEELGRIDSGVPWDRLLFSAKEAIYKALFPLTGAELGFSSARVEFGPATFAAAVSLPCPEAGSTRVESVAGRWLDRESLLVTAVVLDPGALRRARPRRRAGTRRSTRR